VGGVGFVANGYRYDHSYDELRRHYDSELASDGWVFDREESAIYGFPGDRERTGKIAFYSKRNYTARLKYAGPREFQQTGERCSFWVEGDWLGPVGRLLRH